MSKDVKNSHLNTVEAPEQLADAADSLLFSPTDAQVKLKVKFWSRYIPGPLSDLDNISMSEVSEVVKDSRIKKLWNQPGFKEWFLNRDENREKLEYLYTLSLKAAERILTDPEIQASAVVNTMKVVGELANKFPSRYQQEKFIDDEINKMSELQLRAWLERRGISAESSKPKQLEEALDVDYSEEIPNSTPDTDKDSR